MSKKYKNIKFTDFCSGIGGLENLDMTYLGFSEIDVQSYDKIHQKKENIEF